jgi:hypothetical protein
MSNNRKFEELESKIQQLFVAHSKLKMENETLKKENEEFARLVETEKARVKWMEDGYNSLQQAEKSKKNKTIKHLGARLENIINEVDKNIELVSTDKE